MLIFTSLSCANSQIINIDNIDPINGLSRSDSRNAIIKNNKKETLPKQVDKDSEEVSIPNISRLIAIPPLPKIGGDKTISFSVTEQVPLKDVLIELGRVAKIDVDIDPKISGGIILNAKNRPLKEVLDRIATLGQLQYSYENGVLHFERDSAYLKNYFVDYLIDGQLWTDVESNLTSILSAGVPTSDTQIQDDSSSAYYSSNKSAGIISIFATSKQHKMVENYLGDVEKSASAQVLIEAKLVEVTLSDTYKTGIDWTVFGSQNGISTYGAYTSASSSGSAISYIGSGLLGADLAASVSALETFGISRTISSPRLHAINNQKATLNFTSQNIYFKIDSSTSASTTVSSTTTTNRATASTKQEANTGVSLEVTPSINLRTSEVTLNIVPKLSILGTTVTDPASPTGTDSDGATTVISDLVNTVPQINTRELSTIAKIQSGNVLVIGGLMSESATNSDSGIPFLSRIPILGWFFKSASRDTEITETVIFIKATILRSNAVAGKYDKELQRKFDSTKRKFFD